MVRSSVRKNLLLCGMALMILCYLFVVFNTMLTTWRLLERNNVLLVALTALAAAVILLASFAICRHDAFFSRHARAVRAASVLAFFAVQLLFGIQMRFTPQVDCGLCYDAAYEWIQTGAITESQLDLLSITPNNFGLLALFALVLRVMRAIPFLSSVELYYGVMTLNTLLFAAGLWAMLRVVERLRGGATQAIFAANLALCLPLFYFTSELYTDALCMPFLMLGASLLCMMLQARTERAAHVLAAASGVVVLIGMELRATVAIVVIAAAIICVLTCRPRRVLCILTVAAVLAAGHASFMRFRDEVMGAERLRTQSMPAVHWMVMGVPDQYGIYDGSFSVRDYFYARSFEDPQEREAALRQRLYEKLYDLRYPNRLFSALSRKLLKSYGDGTFKLDDIFGTDSSAPGAIKAVLIDDTPQHTAYRHLCTGILLAQMLLACIGEAALVLRRDGPDALEALLAIHLVGVFFFLVIWESNGRYFGHCVPVLIMLSALGQARIARRRLAGGRRA